MSDLFGKSGKRNAPSRIWTTSDTAIAELLGDPKEFGEFVADLKKDRERYFFIPWSQWPVPAKRFVEEVNRMIEVLPRGSRLFRVYAVPDDIASLCMEYMEWEDGRQEYIYRHLIHDGPTMEGVRKRLFRDIGLIEEHFKNTGSNNSFNGVARCH